MAYLTEASVQETSISTGTGSFTLAGSVTGFRTFASISGIAIGDTFAYSIEAVDAGGVPTGEWENGTGTYTAANTLTRTTISGSSNVGAAVNFAAGAKRVTLTFDASLVVKALPFHLEINVSGLPATSGRVVVIGLSGLTVSAPVQLEQVLGPYTGKGTLADEFEMDSVMASGVATSATTMTVNWRSERAVRGAFRFLAQQGPVAVLNAAVATMPTGADLLLYSSDVAAGSNIVRNRAVATPVADNLFGQPRPGLNGYPGVAIQNMTRTNLVAGEDAKLLGTTLVYTSGVLPYADIVLPKNLAAGTYTISLRIISNTANTDVRFSQAGAALSADKPVTLAYSTITHTFVTAGGTNISLSLSPGTALAATDVTFDNYGLFAGSVAGALAGNEQHLVANRKPNLSGNVIENSLSLDARMHCSFSDVEVAVPAISVVMAFRSDPTNDDATVFYGHSITERELGAELATYDGGFALSNSEGRYGLQGTGGRFSRSVGPFKAGWVILAAVGSPTGTSLFINGVRLSRNSTAYAATFRAIDLFGWRNNVAFALRGKTAFAGMWRRALSDSEVGTVTALAITEIATAGEIFVNPGTMAVSEGDSVTAGSVGDSTRGGYITRGAVLFPTKLQIANYALGGSNIDGSSVGASNLNETARKNAAKDQVSAIIASGRRCIFTVLIGTNWNGVGATPAAYYGFVKAYMDEFRALGAKVVVQTMIAVNGTASTSVYSPNPNQALVDAFNTSLRNGFTAGDFDGIVDHAATAMGVWDPNNYNDQLHPKTAGYIIMANTFQAAINGLVI